MIQLQQQGRKLTRRENPAAKRWPASWVLASAGSDLEMNVVCCSSPRITKATNW